ncbi:MAG: MipA/OmpV family protein [Gammaproteobacteria bacterium]|nr:MipA/OmpV family protein [Gammaproteobacteria bacterium]
MFIPLRSTVRFSLIGILLLASASTAAQTLPRWEIGGGLFGVHLPYYRGAAKSRNLFLPYPILRVRGDKYSVDSRDSARRWFHLSDRMTLSMSLGWGLPVPKESTGARKDLDGLPPSLEFGPKLSIRLTRKGKHNLDLKLPLRFGVAADFSGVYYQGWLASPYLYYLYQHWDGGRFRVGAASGFRYSNQSFQNFYYGVPDVYQASGGYGGWWNSLAMYKQVGNFELTLYVRYDFMEGATFADSPLVETRRYLAGGAILTWWFLRSKVMVHVDQRDTDG